MIDRWRIVIVLAVALAAGALRVEASGIRLDLVVQSTDADRTLDLVSPGDGSGRLFLVRQRGRIMILKDGAILPRPFLDLSSRIVCCANSRGLRSLAFHPDFSSNGFFYISYTDPDNDDTVVSRLKISSDPDRARAGSEREILRYSKPSVSHHGGLLAFGPDGYLYIGTGDGGSRDVPQDLGSLLGKILRVDVDGAFPYTIPDDNPFVADPNALDEIWARGVRNPWRRTFDRETGDLFFGDVGGARFEEINFQSADSTGGENYGWPILEGTHCLLADECSDDSLVPPIVAFPHDDPEVTGLCNAVTGGYFYRGPRATTLDGMYLYADFCTGTFYGARRNSAGRWVANQLLDTTLLPATFGEAEDGSLYVADFKPSIRGEGPSGEEIGAVFRVVGQPLFSSDFESGDATDWSQRRGRPMVSSPGLKRSDNALEVAVGGGKKKIFLRSKHTAQTTFSLTFDLNANRVGLADQSIEILRLAGRKKKGHVKLLLEQEGDSYYVNLLARRADGPFENLGRTPVPARRTVKIGVTWMRASSTDQIDGEVHLTKKGKVRVRAIDLANADLDVRAVALGLPAGSVSAASGSFLVDNYSSTP